MPDNVASEMLDTEFVIRNRRNGESLQVGERKVNLSEIARGTGKSLATLSRIFSGDRTPGLRTGQAIAAYLGISLDHLLAELALLQNERGSVERKRSRRKSRAAARALVSSLLLLVVPALVQAQDVGNLFSGFDVTMGVVASADLDETFVDEAVVVDGIVRATKIATRKAALAATIQVTTINCGVPCGPQVVAKFTDNRDVLSAFGLGIAFKLDSNIAFGFGVLWGLNETTLRDDFVLNEPTTSSVVHYQQTTSRRAYAAVTFIP